MFGIPLCDFLFRAHCKWHEDETHTVGSLFSSVKTWINHNSEIYSDFSSIFYQWMKSTGKNSSLVFYSSYTNFACHGKMHFLILKKLFIYGSDTDMCRLSYSQLDSCNSLFFRYHHTRSISLPKPQRFATFGFLKYSSVPNRRACTFINFEKKIPPARSYFGLHVYWFWEKVPPCTSIPSCTFIGIGMYVWTYIMQNQIWSMY